MNWLLISIMVFLLLIVILALIFRKKERPDYYGLFVVGMIWIPVGISLKNYPLVAIGCVSMLIGILKRKEWDKPKTWNELTPQERKAKAIVFWITMILVTLGFIFLFLKQNEIISY